jgi:hypothetical protein
MRPSMSLGRKLLPGLQLVLTVGLAHAEPSLGGPTWSVPSNCPSLDFVEQRVRSLLARPDFTLTTANLQLRGEITRGEARYWLNLELVNDAGQRTRRFESSSCDELAEAAALVLAITIDPSLSRVPEFPKPEFCERPPLPPPPPTSPVQQSVPPKLPPSHTHLGLGPSVSLGALPGITPGIRLELGRDFAWMSLVAQTSFESSRLIEADGRGGDFYLVQGGLGGEITQTFERLRLGLGVNAMAGVLAGRGFGVDRPRRSQKLWLSPGLFVTGMARLGEQSQLGFLLEGFTPLGRPRFQLSEDTVFRPSSAGARLSFVLKSALL